MRVYDLTTYRKSRSGKPSNTVKGLVRFSKVELRTIMSVYSRNIAAGIWRDYGLSCLADRAVFSVYRNTSGRPLYLIEKLCSRRDRSSLYCIKDQTGQIIKQGESLARLIEVLVPNRMHLVS